MSERAAALSIPPCLGCLTGFYVPLLPKPKLLRPEHYTEVGEDLMNILSNQPPQHFEHSFDGFVQIKDFRCYCLFREHAKPGEAKQRL